MIIPPLFARALEVGLTLVVEAGHRTHVGAGLVRLLEQLGFDVILPLFARALEVGLALVVEAGHRTQTSERALRLTSAEVTRSSSSEAPVRRRNSSPCASVLALT